MNNDLVGGKTLSLMRLRDGGFNVPNFVMIEAGADFNVDQIKKELACDSYAVRSSALIEDGKYESFAGQFLTKLNVSFEALADAIEEVRSQGVEYLQGDEAKFSLIVQEYIDADFSGVVFTRNPLGGREMLVEYFAGSGDLVVGGEVRPEKKSFYWGDKNVKIHLPIFPVVEIKKIEKLFDFPQDIEWCIKGSEWYFLQARPITTLNDADYQADLYLDANLADGEFFYEKTEISEIAARPSYFTYSLLKHIYAENGPVSMVYKKYKVNYVAADFLEIVGNELYVDREIELKTLLPCYSYLKHFDGRPHFTTFKGFFRTLKNFFSLNIASLSGDSELNVRLREALNSVVVGDFSERLDCFLADYKLIFEINFLTEKALKALDVAMGKEKISLALVLGHDFGFEIDQISFETVGLRGNCLEIAQEDDFSFAKPVLAKNKLVADWFTALSKIKRELLTKIIRQAQVYARFREYGRCLTVKNISALREMLSDIESAYFFSVDEIVVGHLLPELAVERKNQYLKFNDFNFPSRLSSRIIKEDDGGYMGVSSGEAEGRLVKLEDIDSDGKKILYTEILSPSLVQYFDKVEAIVSENGGMLSHLAIMARERAIPVVTGFSLSKSNIHIGDMIKVDGAKALINVC